MAHSSSAYWHDFYLKHKERRLAEIKAIKLKNGYEAAGSTRNSYAHAKARCNNPNRPAYRWYGARGIRFCDRWSGLGGYRRFLSDMGHRPSAAHQLHRLDSDGDYEPGNCVWSVDHSETK